MSTLRPSTEDEDNYKAGTVDDNVYHAAREYIKTMTLVFEQMPEQVQRLHSQFLASDYKSSDALSKLEDILGLEPINVDELDEYLEERAVEKKRKKEKEHQMKLNAGMKRKGDASEMEDENFNSCDENENRKNDAILHPTGPTTATNIKNLTLAQQQNKERSPSQMSMPTSIATSILPAVNNLPADQAKILSNLLNKHDLKGLNLENSEHLTSFIQAALNQAAQVQAQQSQVAQNMASLMSQQQQQQRETRETRHGNGHNHGNNHGHNNNLQSKNNHHNQESQSLKEQIETLDNTSSRHQIRKWLNDPYRYPTEEVEEQEKWENLIPELMETVVQESQNVKNLIDTLEEQLKISESDAELFRTNFLREWTLQTESEHSSEDMSDGEKMDDIKSQQSVGQGKCIQRQGSAISLDDRKLIPIIAKDANKRDNHFPSIINEKKEPSPVVNAGSNDLPSVSIINRDVPKIPVEKDSSKFVSDQDQATRSLGSVLSNSLPTSTLSSELSTTIRPNRQAQNAIKQQLWQFQAKT